MKATDPLWNSDAKQTHTFLPLSAENLSVDVAIVGGGITGLMSALLLKRAGRTVAVLEARHLLDGVTGLTTAHLTQVIDTRYHVLERKFGREGARLVGESTEAAIDLIERIVEELKIDCGFERLPGFLFAETAAQRDELELEIHAASRAGLRVSGRGIPPLPFPVALAMQIDQQAQLNPRALLMQIAREIHGNGSYVFENTPVTAIREGRPCEVLAARHGSVLASEVIVATHSPLNRVLLQTKLAHYQSYVVSGPVTERLGGLFWDMSDPYHYLRTQQTAEGYQLLIGGEDHKTGQAPDTQAAFDRLTLYARRFHMEPTRRWSGQVIEPVDGLPFIGRNAGAIHVLTATGYAGTGITFGTLAAMILTDRIVGRPNPWADLYEATRIKPLASLKSYLAENVDFPLYLVAGALKGPDVSSLREVKRNEGKLVNHDGKSLAVFRDSKDALHVVSSTCTHLGCKVAFNSAEQTWDCPCHGSRFSVDGEVLEGPAIKALENHVMFDETAEEAAHVPVPRPSTPRPRRSSPDVRR